MSSTAGRPLSLSDDSRDLMRGEAMGKRKEIAQRIVNTLMGQDAANSFALSFGVC